MFVNPSERETQHILFQENQHGWGSLRGSSGCWNVQSHVRWKSKTELSKKPDQRFTCCFPLSRTHTPRPAAWLAVTCETLPHPGATVSSRSGFSFQFSRLHRQALARTHPARGMTEQCVEQQTSQEDVRRSNRGQDRDYQWVLPDWIQMFSSSWGSF